MFPILPAPEGSGPPRGGGGTGGECIEPLNQHRTVRLAQVSSTLKRQPVCRGLRPVSEDEGVLVVELVGGSVCPLSTTHHFGLDFS